MAGCASTATCSSGGGELGQLARQDEVLPGGIKASLYPLVLRCLNPLQCHHRLRAGDDTEKVNAALNSRYGNPNIVPPNVDQHC